MSELNEKPVESLLQRLVSPKFIIGAGASVGITAVAAYFFFGLPFTGAPEAPSTPAASTSAPAPAASTAGSAISADKKSYTPVQVFYATDRNYVADAKPNDTYGAERSSVTYGVCDVTIPAIHETGDLEEPFKFWFIKFPENKDKDVVLQSVKVLGSDEYFDYLKKRVQDSKKQSAFIFVHGFNVPFDEAARRTAQIAYDLKFDGAPLFYSWPSRGSEAPIDYTTDEASAEWAQSDLKRFIEDFLSRTPTKDLYLIAHSMGNRILTKAMVDIVHEQPAMASRVTEIILTAPDIDADTFKRDIAPVLIQAGQNVTLYASSSDKAIKVSEKIHTYPRAGDSGKGLVIVPGMETIDATPVDTSFIGHSYPFNSAVLSDIYYLIGGKQHAADRFDLYKVPTPTSQFWRFSTVKY